MRLIDADALKDNFPNARADIFENCGNCTCLDNEQINQIIDSTPTVNGWISVKDRLPDKNGQYLCWFGKNTIAKGAAIATYLEMWKAFGSLESLVTYPNVTHWMPIEPPEEESDGNCK